MRDRVGLTGRRLFDVLRLVADVAAHRGRADLQRQLMIDGLSRIVGADVGFAFVCDGWKRGLKPRFLDVRIVASSSDHFQTYIKDVLVPYTALADPYCDVGRARAGAVGALDHRDVLSNRKALAKYEPFSQWAVDLKLLDGSVNWARVDQHQDGAMFGFALHRLKSENPFTSRDRAAMRLAMGELRRLATLDYFTLPEFVSTPQNQAAKLPPRLRQVLSLLLAGRHIKGIALDLNLSTHTVREHVQRLYRHFSVNGREQLTALFMPPDKP